MKKKERGLIMSHEMNLALRADKKFVTRRVSSLGSLYGDPGDWDFVGIKAEPNRLEQAVAVFISHEGGESMEIACPYGMVGTPCWIKEAHTSELAFPNAQPHSPNYGKRRPIYKADKQPHVAKLVKWREPYKMPRAYARTFVEITDLTCERLQDITHVGAIDEGMLTLSDEMIEKLFPKYYADWLAWSSLENYMTVPPPVGPGPRERFAALIKKLHDPRVWEENIWAWVIRFKKLHDYE